jgi:hypothetical protein
MIETLYAFFATLTSLSLLIFFLISFARTFKAIDSSDRWWKLSNLKITLKDMPVRVSICVALGTLFLGSTSIYFIPVDLNTVFVLRHILWKSMATLAGAFIFYGFMRTVGMELRMKSRLEKENFIRTVKRLED